MIFFSISLVNHYNYRTFSLDLGVFNQALCDYAHFRNTSYSIMKDAYTCQLGDHFSLYFILLSPLYWVFGTYTLLIIQALSVVIGGYGIYYYAKIKCHYNKWLPLLYMTQFYCVWGIYTALSFDYHDNVVAAMLLPWFIYFFENKNHKKAAIFFILIIIGKENMALWMCFICLGLLLGNLKDKKQLKLSVLLSMVAFVYFIIIVKLVLPFINQAKGGYAHLRYSVLGDNPIATIIHDPIKMIELFFTNHLHDPYFDGVKEETFVMFLVSGGILLVLKPRYLVMLIPIFAQKMFSDDFGKWSISDHYSIEFVPVLTIGAINAIETFKKYYIIQLLLASFLTISTALFTYFKLEKMTFPWHEKTRSQFYTKNHYVSSYSLKSIEEAINLIPQNAKICASSVLIPHIPNFRYIYNYPEFNDANCFFLLEHPDNIYLFTQEQLDNDIRKMRSDKFIVKLYDKNGVCLFFKH